MDLPIETKGFQAAMLRHCISDKARRVLFILSFDSDEESAVVLNSLEEYCQGSSNEKSELIQYFNEQYENEDEGDCTCFHDEEPVEEAFSHVKEN